MNESGQDIVFSISSNILYELTHFNFCYVDIMFIFLMIIVEFPLLMFESYCLYFCFSF